MNLTRNETFGNSTETHTAIQELEDYWKYLLLGVVVQSSITLACGVVSWTLIPKWRLFHNYVFLNIILAGCVNVTCYVYFDFLVYYNLKSAYLILLFNHWLIVAMIMFYMDIVVVFSSSVQWKYLKATIFAWMIPALLLMPKALWGIHTRIFSTIEVLLLSIMYVKVMHALLKMNDMFSNSQKNRCLMIFEQSAAYILSSFIVLYINGVFIFLFKIDEEEKIRIFCCFQTITMVLTNTFILMNRANIQLWVQYIQRENN